MDKLSHKSADSCVPVRVGLVVNMQCKHFCCDTCWINSEGILTEKCKKFEKQ